MSDKMQLRLAAHEIFGEALRAVDAKVAVRNAVQLEPSTVIVCGATFTLNPESPVYSVAIGKAAFSMAIGLEDQLGERFSSGFIAGSTDDRRSRDVYGFPKSVSTRWRFCGGEHPLPNRASLIAGESAIELLDRANHEAALIIFLISGGGSAMMEYPIDETITLANIRIANKVLIASGASIGEINAVRRAFSAVKGGRLAAVAPNCQQITLVVSDVPEGEVFNVASGPTLSPPDDAPSAAQVLERYRLRDQMPSSIVQAVERAEPAVSTESINNPYFVLLDNNTTLEAAAIAARERGFVTEIAHDVTDDPIDHGCEKLLTRVTNLQSQNPDSKVCLISGGEFACPVRGDGIGGRNSETALRIAMALDEGRERYRDVVALCAGTDGIDGNSRAAGAIADSATIERARRMSLEPSHFLNNSASGSFFMALEDAIQTGPTGTNVRDVRILLNAPRA